jgi:hypothetical protein
MPVIVGAGLLMVNARVPDDPPSALITLIVQAPAVIPRRLKVPALMDVGEATFTPVATTSVYPERCRRTPAPGWNPVPVSEMMVTGQPRFPVVGFLAVRVGALPVMVNPLARVPVFPSGLVTVTLLRAAGAPVRSKVQVIWVADATTTLVAVISGPAEAFTSLTVAPFWKLVPTRLVILTVQPRTPVFGVMLVTVGALLVMVKPDVRVPDFPSVFVTVMLYAPAGASDGMTREPVILVADTTLTPVNGMEYAP